MGSCCECDKQMVCKVNQSFEAARNEHSVLIDMKFRDLWDFIGDRCYYYKFKGKL